MRTTGDNRDRAAWEKNVKQKIEFSRVGLENETSNVSYACILSVSETSHFRYLIYQLYLCINCINTYHIVIFISCVFVIRSKFCKE